MHAKHGAVQPQTLFNGAIATVIMMVLMICMHSPRQPKLTPTGMVVSQTLPRKNIKAATKSAGGMPRTQAPLQSIAPAFARAAVLYGLCWFLSRRQPSQRRGTSAPADTQTTVVSVPLPLPCCFTNPPGAVYTTVCGARDGCKCIAYPNARNRSLHSSLAKGAAAAVPSQDGYSYHTPPPCCRWRCCRWSVGLGPANVLNTSSMLDVVLLL